MASRDPVVALREEVGWLRERAKDFAQRAVHRRGQAYLVGHHRGASAAFDDAADRLESLASRLEALESGERKQPRISITYDRASSMYVIGDEDGEFARVAAWTDTWHYITDLLTGPGTLSAGSLFDRTINPELQGTVARLPDNQGAECDE